MKKILTFLVMLVACVSILSAQENLAKFNYQAVVRDATNNFNLVPNQALDVTVEILENADPIFTMNTNQETNFNGMVSFVITEEEPGQFMEIDWSNVSIKATFKKGNDIVSVVETPVMAVPYALQSGIDPMIITTQKIVDYIGTASGNSVDSIYKAIIANENVSKAMRDSIVNYIKTQDSVVRELAFYYLAKVTPADLDQAKASLTTETKQAIKDNIKAYLKSANGKELVYDVVEDYLTNTTKAEVQELWAAARANEQFHEIFNAVRDSVIDYVKHHEDLVVSIVKYYIDSVITVNDVTQFHNYLKTAQNGTIYQYMLDKFNNYLNHYLSDVYKAANNVGCEDVTVCGLQEQIDQLKEAVNPCPTISAVSITESSDATSAIYTFTATLSGDLTGVDVVNKLDVQSGGVSIFTIPNLLVEGWHQIDNTKSYSISYRYEGELGGLIFVLSEGDSCPASSKPYGN